MGRLLDRLNRDDPAYELVATDNGLMLTARDGQSDRFTELARDLIDNAGEDFVAFPTSDGRQGYERVFLTPLP